MSDIESQPWYQLYALALMELDPDRLRELASTAETAMRERLKELQSCPDDHEERDMIADARTQLATICRDG